MSMSAIRKTSALVKILSSNKNFLFNTVPRSFFNSSRIIARSHFYLNPGRLSNVLRQEKLSTSRCCSCSAHSKADEELGSFLDEEISDEKKAHISYDQHNLEGFNFELDGADVTLSKKVGNETIKIVANVNSSVDDYSTVNDPNTTQESEPQMLARPNFRVEIQRGKRVLCFECQYTQSEEDGQQEGEAYNDAFEISQVYLHEGEVKDSTYVIDGEIMDGYLYDLLMNYLDSRGVSNDFVDKLEKFFTSHEHQLYIKLLENLKAFVAK